MGFRVQGVKGQGGSRPGQREELNWHRLMNLWPTQQELWRDYCPSQSCYLGQNAGGFQLLPCSFSGSGLSRERAWAQEGWRLTAEVNPGVPALGSSGYFLKGDLAERLWIHPTSPLPNSVELHSDNLRERPFPKDYFPYSLETFLSGTLDNYSFCSGFGSGCQDVV